MGKGISSGKQHIGVHAITRGAFFCHATTLTSANSSKEGKRKSQVDKQWQIDEERRAQVDRREPNRADGIKRIQQVPNSATK